VSGNLGSSPLNQPVGLAGRGRLPRLAQLVQFVTVLPGVKGRTRVEQALQRLGGLGMVNRLLDEEEPASNFATPTEEVQQSLLTCEPIEI